MYSFTHSRAASISAKHKAKLPHHIGCKRAPASRPRRLRSDGRAGCRRRHGLRGCCKPDPKVRIARSLFLKIKIKKKHKPSIHPPTYPSVIVGEADRGAPLQHGAIDFSCGMAHPYIYGPALARPGQGAQRNIESGKMTAASRAFKASRPGVGRDDRVNACFRPTSPSGSSDRSIARSAFAFSCCPHSTSCHVNVC